MRRPVHRHYFSERVHALKFRKDAQRLRMHGSGQQEENQRAARHSRRIPLAGRPIRNPVRIPKAR